MFKNIFVSGLVGGVIVGAAYVGSYFNVDKVEQLLSANSKADDNAFRSVVTKDITATVVKDGRIEMYIVLSLGAEINVGNDEIAVALISDYLGDAAIYSVHTLAVPVVASDKKPDITELASAIVRKANMNAAFDVVRTVFIHKMDLLPATHVRR